MKKEKKKVVFDEESKDDVDIDDIDLESFGSKKKKKKKRGGNVNLEIIPTSITTSLIGFHFQNNQERAWTT